MAKKSKYYEYDPKRRRLAKLYSRQKLIMHLGNDIIVPLAFIAIFFFAGAFSLLAGLFTAKFGTIIGIIMFIVGFTTLLYIFQFPLRIYASYFYEHKYGLSRQDLAAWLVDYFKMSLLSYVLVVPIGAVTAYLAMRTPLWWLYASIVSIIFFIILDFVYPVLILPIIYKLVPYKDKKELKVILGITRKAGATDLKHVKVLKESEKSTKVNAMFAGFGSTKSVILYDNLIDKFPKREMRTVVGHELGHYVHKDTLRFIVIEAIETVVMLFLTDYIIRTLFLGGAQAIPLAYFPIISAILIVLGFIMSPASMWYSRRQETQADLFALDEIRDPFAQISTEKRLVDLDLGDESPHPLIEFWLHSHPSAEKRIEFCKSWMRKNKNYIKS